VLKKISLPNTTIKWPNDIMSHSKKVAGILIENQIKKGKIISSVIGVGLNVNEEKFNNLSQATSILLATGIKHNLDELLLTISKAILEELETAEKGEFQLLKAAYENSLFRKNKITVFENSMGDRFNGIIKGVTDLGEIVIENEQEILNNYYSKELKYLF
jgi:BirA family biotin operon repressor/biotin-[acetyl-CoA-carboxylase] ligase